MCNYYKCYCQRDDADCLELDELFYMVKNYYLIEICLENRLYIRQWKDLDCQLLNKEWETIDMSVWKLYLTDWENLLDVWDWWWEEELGEWIDKCKAYFKS